MSAKNYVFHTVEGMRASAFPANPDDYGRRDVIISLGVYPLSMQTDCTPEEARQIAALLIAAADEAEGRS